MPGLVAAPAEMRAKTKALLENHIALHDSHSIYLLTVPGSVSPNVSLGAELVLEQRLVSRCVGVFTMVDDVPKRKLALLSNRMQSDPDLDSGAVQLMPHGWVATMNVPIDTPSDNGLARLRLQAEAEEAWFQENMPEAVQEGRAACGALVSRLALLFHSYLQRDWGPRTLDLIDEQLDRTRDEIAALGVPALQGQPESARTLALEEVLRILHMKAGDIMQRCCRVVLERLKTDVAHSVETHMIDIGPEDFVPQWSQQRRRVEECLQRASKLWVQFNVDCCQQELLTRPDSYVGAGQVSETATGCFVLARFPFFVDKVLEELHKLLHAAATRALRLSHHHIQTFFDASSPLVESTTDLLALPATMTVVARSDKLAESIILSWLTIGSVAQLPGLTERLSSVAQSVTEWDESCAQERAALVGRQTELIRAREGVIGMLGGDGSMGFSQDHSEKGCSENCSMIHADASECLVCSQPWSRHFGHYCHDGRRGSWPLDEESESGRFLKTMF